MREAQNAEKKKKAQKKKPNLKDEKKEGADPGKPAEKMDEEAPPKEKMEAE